MSEDDRDEGEAARPPDDGTEFELPLPDEESGRKLRRRLFGLRSRDVEEEISARRGDIAELRRDVAALWLAFGQHERTIRQLLEAVERMAGTRIEPPGGRGSDATGTTRSENEAGAGAPDSSTRPEAERAATAGTPAADPDLGPIAATIGDQLTDLDQVLAAIERATNSLERTYAEEIAADRQRGEPAAGVEPGAEEDRPAPGEESGQRGE